MWNFTFFFNSILIGVGLAMDAFSVSLANGLNEPCMKRRRMTVKIPIWEELNAPKGTMERVFAHSE